MRGTVNAQRLAVYRSPVYTYTLTHAARQQRLQGSIIFHFAIIPVTVMVLSIQLSDAKLRMGVPIGIPCCTLFDHRWEALA